MPLTGGALRALDACAALLAYPAGVLLREIRRVGVGRLPASRRALLRAGVFPIRDHYYEPRFDYTAEDSGAEAERALPGIDWNPAGQLAFLAGLGHADELAGLDGELDLRNGLFEAGDAEVWYQVVRHLKPRRIYEVGSGHSTRIAQRALRRNREEDPAYTCEHLCIEPYEAPWLAETGATVIRQRVETLGPAFFGALERGDVLFIDSSHVIRPGGDVVFEYLEVLPTLRSGVVVHVHDVFTPRGYPRAWLAEEVRFWNEQYLLEAFLTHNAAWEILAALNHLRHHHYDALLRVAPLLTPEREPGSFYLRRR